MKGSNLTTLNLDNCPKHNFDAKKTYYFGKYRDVELTTFIGCQCTIVFENNGFNDPAKHYNSYSQGAGAAKLATAETNIW